MGRLLFLAAAAWGSLLLAAVAWGCRWQSVKPTAAPAPPTVPADSTPEEGNHA